MSNGDGTRAKLKRGPGRRPEKGRNNGPAGRGNGHRPRNGGARPKEQVERYLALAADAAAAGDIVNSEYYYQHAEHYLRLMNAERA